MNTEERIDRYVSGLMEGDERQLFETEMSQDKNLEEEVRLQQEVVLAIQKKGLRQMMQDKEKEIRTRAARRWIYLPSALLAACLVIGIFFRIGHVRDCKELGESIVLEAVQMRGESDSDEILDAINAGKYEDALCQIEALRRQIPEFDLDSEEGQYDKMQFDNQMEDLDWFEAVTYMRMGKVRKARQCLSAIASNPDGAYASQAAEALKTL